MNQLRTAVLLAAILLPAAAAPENAPPAVGRGALPPPAVATADAPDPRAAEHPAGDLPPAVVAALEGIVSVRVREAVRVPVYRGGRFHDEEVEGLGAGSGIVVSADGLILTNAHVVAGSAEVTVRPAYGAAREARVVALDEASDLALLRAPAEGLRPIAFAEGVPGPGSPAFILGNRGDRGPEVSFARLGRHRRVRAGARPLEFWGEVEATIGPGNSGGALLDGAGQIIGMPSLLVSFGREAARPADRQMGLFIPVGHLRRSLARMREGPRPTWTWIGLVVEDPLFAAETGAPWDGAAGVRVRRVQPGSPAEPAGFRPRDRIVAVGPRPVRDHFEALEAVLDLAPGLAIAVEIERDGSPLTIQVTPAARPPDPRPDPRDDFALHTGLALDPPAGGENEAPPGLLLRALTDRARAGMPAVEAELFARGPRLESILPGRMALAGQARRQAIGSVADLEAALRDCFVEGQFVAFAHWSVGGRQSLDRAHVRRKIYPVVL